MANFKSKKKFMREVLEPLAAGYGVETATESFSIEPSTAQRLSDKMVEKSTFLAQINNVPVEELLGENILGFVGDPVTSRTDTSGAGERKAKEALQLGKYGYKLAKTDSDVAIKYVTIDSWAKFPDLADRFSRYVEERRADDRELIGWHGVSVAADTDLALNPLLQDVNKGWLQYERDNLPANVIAEGNTVGEVRIGTDGDWSCLDVAINDLISGIPYWLRKNLVALIGDDLVAREREILFEAVSGPGNGPVPTEKAAMAGFSTKYGGLSWQTPSFFPARGLVITALSNLSLYHQETSWRRHLKDHPEKDQYEDFLSRNEGYVIECPEAFVAVEFANVKLPFKKTDGTMEWR